jgi:hypothetical protein
LAEGAGISAKRKFFFSFFSYYLAEGAGTTREAKIFSRLAIPVNLRRGNEARSANFFFSMLFLCTLDARTKREARKQTIFPCFPCEPYARERGEKRENFVFLLST